MSNQQSTINNSMNSFSWKDALNFIGTRGIVKNLGFWLYCSFLLMIYITATHTNDNMVRSVNTLQSKIKELNWQYLDEKSKLMFVTKESELQKLASNQGLEIITTPNYKVEIINNK